MRGRRVLKHFTMVTQVLTQVLKKKEKLGMKDVHLAQINKITEGEFSSPFSVSLHSELLFNLFKQLFLFFFCQSSVNHTRIILLFHRQHVPVNVECSEVCYT